MLGALKNQKDLSMLPEIESGRARAGVMSEEEETSRKFKLKLSEMNVSLNKRGPQTNDNQPRPLSFGNTKVTSPKCIAPNSNSTIKLQKEKK